MTVERAGAQRRALQDVSDGETPDPLLVNGFRCGGENPATDVGVGSELLAPAAWSGLQSRGRVVGARVLGESFADVVGGQPVVGQVVIMGSAGAGLVSRAHCCTERARGIGERQAQGL